MTEKAKEEMNKLALQVFSKDIIDGIDHFKDEDKAIKQIDIDYLSGLSLLMKQCQKVSLYEFLYSCNNFTTIEFPLTFNTVVLQI